MSTMVLGAFTDRRQANEVIDELEREGARSEDFSLIAQGHIEERESQQQTGSASTGRDAGRGAATGGTIGGVAGLIAGAFATAGLFVAGPFAILMGLGLVGLTTVVGGAVGALAGGLVGALVGLGVPRQTAEHYDMVVQNGGVVLGIEDSDVPQERLMAVMNQHGAQEVHPLNHVEISQQDKQQMQQQQQRSS